jgi:uncharacterized tellurite resistance protein B-like protein
MIQVYRRRNFMLARIREIFVSSATVEESPETAEERKLIAACVLMLEAATADSEYSEEESVHVLQTLRTRYRLSQDDAEELMDVARKRREDSFDLWQFTNQININCGIDEKLEIVEELWRVVYADGKLDGHEDYLMHKFRKLLNLTHKQLIDAKVKVLDEVRDAAN